MGFTLEVKRNEKVIELGINETISTTVCIGRTPRAEVDISFNLNATLKKLGINFYIQDLYNHSAETGARVLEMILRKMHTCEELEKITNKGEGIREISKRNAMEQLTRLRQIFLQCGEGTIHILQ